MPGAKGLMVEAALLYSSMILTAARHTHKNNSRQRSKCNFTDRDSIIAVLVWSWKISVSGAQLSHPHIYLPNKLLSKSIIAVYIIIYRTAVLAPAGRQRALCGGGRYVYIHVLHTTNEKDLTHTYVHIICIYRCWSFLKQTPPPQEIKWQWCKFNYFCKYKVDWSVPPAGQLVSYKELYYCSCTAASLRLLLLQYLCSLPVIHAKWDRWYTWSELRSVSWLNWNKSPPFMIRVLLYCWCAC